MLNLMLNLKVGDKAVHISYSNIMPTIYKIVTIVRETRTQLVADNGTKFNKKDGSEAVAYSAWSLRDKLAELTPEMEAKVKESDKAIYRRKLVSYMEDIKFNNFPTEALEQFKKIVEQHTTAVIK